MRTRLIPALAVLVLGAAPALAAGPEMDNDINAPAEGLTVPDGPAGMSDATARTPTEMDLDGDARADSGLEGARTLPGPTAQKRTGELDGLAVQTTEGEQIGQIADILGDDATGSGPRAVIRVDAADLEQGLYVVPLSQLVFEPESGHAVLAEGMLALAAAERLDQPGPGMDGTVTIQLMEDGE